MHNQRPPTSAAVRKVTFVVVVVFYNTLYKGSWPWLSYQLSVCEGQQGGFNYLVKEQWNSTGVSLRGNGWKHQTCNLSAKHPLSVNEQRLIPTLCENWNNLTFMFTVTYVQGSFKVHFSNTGYAPCFDPRTVWNGNIPYRFWPIVSFHCCRFISYCTWSNFEFTVPTHSKCVLCQGFFLIFEVKIPQTWWSHCGTPLYFSIFLYKNPWILYEKKIVWY